MKDTMAPGPLNLRWAATIIGIVMALCTGTLGYTHTALGSLETRVRAVEQNDAANAARFEAIRDSLHRLEAKASK